MTNTAGLALLQDALRAGERAKSAEIVLRHQVTDRLTVIIEETVGHLRISHHMSAQRRQIGQWIVTAQFPETL